MWSRRWFSSVGERDEFVRMKPSQSTHLFIPEVFEEAWSDLLDTIWDFSAGTDASVRKHSISSSQVQLNFLLVLRTWHFRGVNPDDQQTSHLAFFANWWFCMRQRAVQCWEWQFFISMRRAKTKAFFRMSS